MPSFKDEHVLIIVPGSQTTLAQLGLPESFTPARLRVSSRMFPAEKKGEWEPLKVRERKIVRLAEAEEITDLKNGDNTVGNSNGARDRAVPRTGDTEEDTLYEEDPTTEESAVFPLHAGRVVNWSCFLALLTHVFNTLSPPFHTPILVVSQPAWTAKDHERLAQFFFEKFKTPAFCLMDSALAVSYAYATPTATVVDIGHSKCDITAVSDFVVSDIGRVIALAGCGGEGLTQRLFNLLGPKGFTKDMCEQLKRSAICEVLQPGIELPVEDASEDRPVNPASAASAGANGPGYGSKGSISTQGGLTGAVGSQIIVGDDDQDRDGKEGEENEGVLDVASIVVSGKTSEWVAKKEREKAEKAAAKKAASDSAGSKLARLPNSKRAKITFHYNERRPLDDLNLSGQIYGASSEGNSGQWQKTPDVQNDNAQGSDVVPSVTRKEERRKLTKTVAFIRKDIEVGIERFQAASGGILDQIVDSIHRCILSVPEVTKRSELWDSLIIVGNGSKIKGLKDAIISTLNARYLISPSSATIFTSELPSNFTTPIATGTNTPQPQPQQHPSLPQSSSSSLSSISHHGPPAAGAAVGGGGGVNPLLLAATTASSHLAPPTHSLPQQQLQQYYQQQLQQGASAASAAAAAGATHPHQQQQQHLHSGHGQTPTSIKVAKMPEYFPEWKEVGTEEVAFLGAQVAAKVVFVVDQGLSKGFMSRTEYNELGPQGIHECCL